MHNERWLPRYLAFAYALLTTYACLHPFSGWRDTGVSPFAFFIAPWPRYFTARAAPIAANESNRWFRAMMPT